MLNFVNRTFEELTLKELYQVIQLRQEVFIVEQDCPYLDLDGLDYKAFHLLGFDENELMSYARILQPGLNYTDYASIGRVVNSKLYRGKGMGKKLMKEAISLCRLKYPNHSIKISAQVYLDKFYSDLGFKHTGDNYLEDGIPHQSMVLK